MTRDDARAALERLRETSTQREAQLRRRLEVLRHQQSVAAKSEAKAAASEAAYRFYRRG